MDNQQGLTVWHREPCSGLCNNLNGKIIWKGIDPCICITESLCCTPETNTTLLINYVPIWNIMFKKYVLAAAAATLLQSCPTLCDSRDGSPPGSPVPGILQARTLEWVAISFSNARKWKVKSESEVAQSGPTLSNPLDCSLPGSSVHGIFQARVLEWVAFSDFIAKKC